MAFEPTEEQRLALSARGSILVSAAAGSGKTAVLSHRAVSRILDPDDPVDVNDMLIVTFTNAAAAEMRQRISTILTEKANAAENDRRALEQRADLDNAAIGTIDAFCLDLVRENFETTGIRPDFRIASAERLALLEERAAREALNALLLAEPAAFRRLTTSLWEDGSMERAVADVRRVFRYTQAMPFPRAWLDRVAADFARPAPLDERPWTQALLAHTFDRVDFAVGGLQRGMALLREDETLAAAYGEAFAQTMDNLLRVREAAKSGRYDNVRAAFAQAISLRLKSARDVDEALRERAKRAYDEAKKCLKAESAFYEATAAEQENALARLGEAVGLLCRTVAYMSDRLMAQKRETNFYDFADLEHAALSLLCDEKDGRPLPREGEWKGRFREVMVDEYQDTNDLQDAIFYALSDEGRHAFLVGDVKQCIYRFRRANPANFLQKKDAFAPYDGVSDPAKIALRGNFRSRSDICDYVNHTFRLLMTREAAQMDYGEEDALRPLGTFPAVEEPAVTLHVVEGPDLEAEAAYTAAALRRAYDEGLLVTDKEGTLRPLRWEDVVILIRSCKGAADVYVRALEAAGIPAWTSSKEGFAAREEIQMALALLRAIDNPLRDVPLLAALMSPVFGFTAEEIARIRLRDPKGTLYAALKADAAEQPKSAAFLARLDRFRRWAGTLPSDRLIRQVMDDVGLTAIVRAGENGAVAYANLMMLAAYAADYESGGYRGLTAFLRYWERVERNGGDVPGAVVQEGENAVRVLSIHAAKGLQAPLVVLAATSRAINQRDAQTSLVLNEELGIGSVVYDDAACVRSDTVARTAIAFRERRETTAEELRLLYVAMTRAQDHLWLMVRADDPAATLSAAASRLAAGWSAKEDALDPYLVASANKVSDWLLSVALLHPDAGALRELAGEAIRPVTAPGRLAVVVGQPPADPTQEAAETKGEEMDFSPFLDYVYPYEDVLRFEAKYSVSQLAKSDHRVANCCTSRPAFITGDRLTAAEKGTATHRFMCFADYEAARRSVSDEIARLVAAGRLTPEQGEGIDVATVEAFFDSDLYRRVCAADRVLRESRFLYEMPVSQLDPSCASEETVVVQGVADLVLFEPDGVTIVDFKTDRHCTPEDLIAKYTRQLAVYADAFASDYHVAKKTPYLYSFYLKEAIPLPDAVDQLKKI